MSLKSRNWLRPVAGVVGSLALASSISIGCAGFGNASSLLGYPLIFVNQAGGGTTDGGGGTTGGDGGFFGGGGGGTGPTDPCDETISRKFIRISMRNLAQDDFIHYFVGFVAFVNSDQYPNGAVCEADLSLYTSFGYQSIPEGSRVAFGNYCIEGPALLYFHRNGQFRTAGSSGSTGLASAIAPAQGTSTPTFDSFFTSSGAQVPVPNVILFHNPGGAAGNALRISRGNPQPCADGTIIGVFDECTQDSFYYVDDTDRLAGSSALGEGSSRRVPQDIQGTACECPSVVVIGQGEQVLLPPTTAVRNRNCNMFARGGRIDYAFLRDDQNPPIPQLVWRVTDSTGSVIQDFDSRVDVP